MNREVFPHYCDYGRCSHEQLDAQGRWVEVFAGEHLMGQPKFPLGFRYISSHTFNVNVAKLCDYLRGG